MVITHYLLSLDRVHSCAKIPTESHNSGDLCPWSQQSYNLLLLPVTISSLHRKKYCLCPSSWALEMEVDFCCDKLKMLNDFQAVRSKILCQIWRKKKAIILLCCPQWRTGPPSCFKKAREDKAQLQPAGQV